MAESINNLASSIVELLKESPASISDISAKLKINWRTAASYLKLLKSLGLAKEQKIKNKNVFFYLDKDNYFSLPIKPKDKVIITTIYALIRKFCKNKFNKEPTKTHVYKILWRLKKETSLNPPIGWYLHGPCAIQIYQGDEKELIKLDNKTIDLIKETTEEYCEYDNITLQKKIYGDENNRLYQLKEKILDAEEGQDILLLELIKIVPKEAVDLTSDFARSTLALKWEKTRPLFEKFWKYIAMIIFKDTLIDYYGDDIGLYLNDKIESAKKDIELLLDDVVRTYMDAKYSQDELYQRWIQRKK